MSKLRDSEEASVAGGREWPRWRWRGDEAAGVGRCQIRQVRAEGVRFCSRCSGSPLKELTQESDELITQALNESTLRAQGTRCDGLSGRAVRDGFLEGESLWFHPGQS